MVIDFHTHTFPEKIASKTLSLLSSRSKIIPFTNGCLDGLKNSMQYGNIDLSIVLPVVTKPEQFKTITECALQINETEYKNGSGILSFAGVHPKSEHYKEELKAIKSLGFKGIKLHPDYQDTMIDDISYLRLIDEASNQDLIISIHAGIDVGLGEPVHCPPKAAANMLKQVKPEKLILAHGGGFAAWDEVEQYIVGKNVYLDTAVIWGNIKEDQFLRILKNHGEDRILFATDSPWSGQKESVETISHLPIPESTKDKILYKNALELLQLN